jgi:hypothetical protein
MKISGQFVRRAVRPWLALSFVISAAGAANVSGYGPGSGPTRHACRAELLRITLQPTAEARGAAGMGLLYPAYAPTGFAVSEKGTLVYDIEATFSGLGGGSATGAHYIAWIAEPTLVKVIKLGEISNGSHRFENITLNKFILLVTIEPNAAVATRSGPIVLRGISPSGLLQSFIGHELFSGGGPC